MFVSARGIQSAAMLIVLAGCGGLAPLGKPTATPPRPTIQPLPASTTGNGSVRTVCRGTSVGGNWAIIDYDASRQCDSRGSTITYNAMLIEDLSFYAIGATVLICADQRRPSDWDFTGADVGVTNQCPREPTNKTSSPMVVEIVRRRGSK
jgi:hypothetical protein